MKKEKEKDPCTGWKIQCLPYAEFSSPTTKYHEDQLYILFNAPSICLWPVKEKYSWKRKYNTEYIKLFLLTSFIEL